MGDLDVLAPLLLRMSRTITDTGQKAGKMKPEVRLEDDLGRVQLERSKLQKLHVCVCC